MLDGESVRRLGVRVETGDDGNDGGIEKLSLPTTHEVDSAPMAPAEQKAVVGKPFVLSEGLPPVPHKLVIRVLRGDFVDMAELLRNNLEAQRRLLSVPVSSSSPSTPSARARREVPDLLSWVQCFGTYVAIVTSKYPAFAGLPNLDSAGGQEVQGERLASL